MKICSLCFLSSKRNSLKPTPPIEELDFDAAILVGADLFPLRADDNGRLRAVDDRPGGDSQRPVRQGSGDAGEVVVVIEIAASACNYPRSGRNGRASPEGKGHRRRD